MDFSRLKDIPLDATTRNPIINMISVALETMFPGYSFIHKLVLDKYGFDITAIVSIPLVLLAAIQGSRFIWNQLFDFFSAYFTSSVFLEDSEDIFHNFLYWISEQRMTKTCRSLGVRSRNVFDDDDDDQNSSDDGTDVINEFGLFDYDSWSSKLPLRYLPYFGRYTFWHKKQLFFFTLTKLQRNDGAEDNYIEITCLGRYTHPLKNLLNEVKQWSASKEKHLTTIRRPAAHSSGSIRSWQRVLSRPSRPMSTVSLDMAQKVKVVKDINEYLHPATQRWYAARGIPHRRGYLFHGPPGTGKTSLSFALAGLFGLDIYCVSLQEPTLTENDLAQLFNNLPRRCIILLEDIDTAGLRRPEDKEETTSEDTKDEKADAATLAKAVTEASRQDGQGDLSKTRISLSGLLNAIDGVSSHEGRVLIMTTNHPEKLDAALIRPGRIDLQVQFTQATREQIRDIFIRMYTISDDEVVKHNRISRSDEKQCNGKPNGTTEKANGHANGHVNGHAKPPKDEFYQLLASDSAVDEMNAEELEDMAERFAERLPDEKFSPAEIQGFLLIRKKEPRRALDEVEVWRDGMLEAKEKKSKVVGVQ